MKPPLKVLLVEDSELARDMLSRRLAKRGYAIATAADGREGVEKAGAEAPDVILMDLTLPVLDGLEATRRIKRDPKTSAIPIIALTARVTEADEKRALDAGCDAFHTKPGDFAELLSKIAALTSG
jgi:two-component system, cell cycle response regulator DivK